MSVKPAMKKRPVYDWVREGTSFLLRRDNAPLKTPAGEAYALPTENLARKLVEEWRAQGEKPNPAQMPFTQLAATAIDVIGKKRESIVASLAAVAASDLLCHRADEPPELLARQVAAWQPWLDLAAQHYGASLQAGQGIMPIVQTEASLTILRDAVAAYDIFRLAGLQQAVGVTGSLILALALAEGALTVDQAFAAAELEQLFQIEQWGEDPVTTDRHASLKRELELCVAWFGALKA